MRRSLSVMLSFLLLCPFFSLPVKADSGIAPMAQFYVSPTGSDSNDGTLLFPFQTIYRAQQAARQVTANRLTGDVEIILRGGTYELTEPLRLTREDSGNNGFSVVYKGYKNEYPTISGGRRIAGFTHWQDGIWKVSAPGFDVIRELYVEGKRAYRASSEEEYYPLAFYDDPATAYPQDGYYFEKGSMDVWNHNGDVELFFATSWRSHIQVIKEIVQDPVNEHRVIAKGVQPAFIQSINIYNDKGQFLCRPGVTCRIENALPLLNNPGEFYFDKATKELYYMPKEGEDLTTAEVVAPLLERVMFIDGGGNETGTELAENLRFEGLRFAHATYLTVDRMGGHSNMQANESYFADSRDNTEDWASIEVDHAKNIHFSKCVVFGMGSGGIRYRHTVYDSSVTGCAFYDLGGSAVVVGSKLHIRQKNEEQPVKPERVDMYEHATWEVSDCGIYGENPSIVNYYSNGVHPMNDINRGIKSWFKMKMDVPVSIEEIYYGYYTESPSVAEEMKHNFEIYGSNDPTYTEKTLLYRQGEEAVSGEGVTITPADTTTKFQYLLIQATEVQEFGFKELHVYTRDYPWVMRETPRRIKIDNNYVTRVGLTYMGCPGIAAYYTHDLSVSHNEIDTVPWAGISSGWGWDCVADNPTTRTKINYNYITDYTIRCSDGGAIYTLSRSRDSEISHNYMENGRGLYAGIYNDMGSEGFAMDSNVMEDSVNAFFFWTTVIKGNTAANNFANQGLYRDVTGGLNSVDPIQLYIDGNPPAGAKQIMNEAGMEADYEGIKAMVPDGAASFDRDWKNNFNSLNVLGLTDWLTALEGRVTTALSLARCGTLPGEYSGQKKLVMEERYRRLLASEGEDNETRMALAEALKAAIDDFEASHIRYSLPETVAFAERLMAEYPMENEEGEKLSALIAQGKAANADDYQMLINLEEGMINYGRTLQKADILGFVIEGEDGIPVIDERANTITLRVGNQADLSALQPRIETSCGAVISPSPDTPVDFHKPRSFTVTNGDVSEEWSVTVLKEENWEELTTGKEAWATTYYNAPSDVRYPSYAIDGDPDTGYVSGVLGSGQQYWAVDLGYPCDIREISFDTRYDFGMEEERANLRVQVSNSKYFLGKDTVTLAAYSVPYRGRQRIAVDLQQPYRYLRIGKTEEGGLSLYDVQVKGRPLVNEYFMDLLQTDAASFYDTPHDKRPPSLAVDGDPDTFYVNGSLPASGQQQWMVDLGDAYRIAEVRFYTSPADRDPNERKNFKLQASNDITFSTAVDLTDYYAEPCVGEQRVICREDTAYRYLRFVKEKDDPYLAIGEVQVLTVGDPKIKLGFTSSVLDKTPLEGELPADGNFILRIKADNAMKELDRTVCLFVAAYEETDGVRRMVDFSIYSDSLQCYTEDTYIEMDGEKGRSYRIFAWDGDTLNPLSEVHTLQ